MDQLIEFRKFNAIQILRLYCHLLYLFGELTSQMSEGSDRLLPYRQFEL